MTIDVRFLLPAMAPIGILLLLRVVWFLAGAEWSHPEAMAGISCLIGIFGGVVCALVLFTEEAEIGKIKIGKSND